VEYVRLSTGLKDYKLIPSTENIWDHIKSNNVDHYVSLYHYNQSQYEQWKTKGTVSGIKDVVTNKIFFDFDSATDPEIARQDAITTVSRLLSKGVASDNIQIAFSGKKGYSVEVDTTESFTPDEFKNITKALAADLQTFDPVVADPQRIIRVIGTKHPKSGLYKYPLTAQQLSELPIDVIKSLAADVSNIDESVMDGWVQVVLPESISSLKYSKKKETKTVAEVHDLDLSKKPKWLSDAKYALQEGYFGAGERNTAFMIMGSTYKGQGFSKEITYRALKGVAEVQAERNGVERYSDKELWNNIVEVIYKPDWKGGTYSYDNTPLLQDVTKRLGLKVPNIDNKPIIPLSDVSSVFRKFATDIDSNTIKLGIPAIDKDVRITTSMLVGLVSPPGGGKTTTAFEILNNASNSNTPSMFFSMDMGAPLVFQRLIQKHTGLYSRKIFDMYQTDDKKLVEIEKDLMEQYNNVGFCFKSGLSVEEIREHIIERQIQTDQKIKLVVIDYLECISSGFQDATASGAYVTQKLKDIANELELTVLLLLQPPKVAGDPSDEISSYTKIKGSSVIQQACSVIFSMWRPGFSPKTPHEDRFVCFSVLKNRMGSLAQYRFGWDGLTGAITELDELELTELNNIIARKDAEKNSTSI